MATDWQTTRAELADAKEYRLLAMAACEAYVERLAAEGDEEAATLTRIAADSARQLGVANLRALFRLPASPPKEMNR